MVVRARRAQTAATSPQREKKLVPTKQVICPDCGLVLSVEDDDKLAYDVEAWKRMCKRVQLDGPFWCLIQRDGPALLTMKRSPTLPGECFRRRSHRARTGCSVDVASPHRHVRSAPPRATELAEAGHMTERDRGGITHVRSTRARSRP